MTTKRFSIILLILSAALLSGTALLNYLVNPYLLYPTRIVEPLVQTPREDKYELLLSRPTPPDALILGSSRAERISSTLATELSGFSTFNAAVSRSTPVDFIVWTRFLIDGLNHTPKLLIVSLDPEAFNPEQAWLTTAWLTNSPFAPYASDITLTTSGDPVEDALRKLFSWQQTLDSLQVLQLEVANARPERAVFYDADGGYTFVEETTADASSTVPDTGYLIPFYQNYPALSQEALHHLELFLQLCAEHQITLVIFLPPYHDDLLATLRAETDFQARHDELVATIEALGNRYDLVFHDLVEAASFDGIPEIFFNGDHMDRTNSDLLLAHILSGRLADS